MFCGDGALLAAADEERSRLFVLLTTDVRAKNTAEAVGILEEAAFKYLLGKNARPPNDIFTRETYDDEAGNLSSQRLESSSLKIWSARLTEPDAAVPARSWSLELLIGQTEDKISFSSRLSCFSRNLDFYFEPAVPRIYKDLTERGVLYADGAKLSRWPRDVTTDEEVDWLIALINNKRRARDIIVVSADQDGTCFINPAAFANRLSAIAHVVRIFPSASFSLSEKIGRYFSVFDNGVRIYRPTLGIEADEPYRHPLYTKRRLQTIDLKNARINIAREAFRTSVETGLRVNAVPSFALIRTESLRFKLSEFQEANADSVEISNIMRERDLALAAKVAAEAQAKEALDLAAQEDALRRQAEDEREQERARSMAMNARIRSLESRLQAPAAIILPTNFLEIPDWVDQSFAGRMTLHPRALRSLRAAQYHDVRLTCELLQFLAVSYVDSKRGDAEAWQAFEREIESRGVRLSRSISEERAGQEGDEYFLMRRGRKEFLEWHLKKGNSRDPVRDLRIYFIWDEIDQEIVLGWLPGHLNNRLS